MTALACVLPVIRPSEESGAPATSGHGAGADTITVRERQVDVNPGEINICTGATGTIIDDEQDVFHITTLADGTAHLTGHSTVTVTFAPEDPKQVAYAGHETFGERCGQAHLGRARASTLASPGCTRPVS
jgi:hypothetical protein